MLKTFLKGRETKVPRISIEQYNREIDEAIARVEAGELFPRRSRTDGKRPVMKKRKIL
jgi:hypothetical protein